MTRITLFLASLALVASSAASAVVDLDPKNFDSVVLKSGTPSLVEFFAPWCGHCKNLAPIYDELAQSFQHASKKVVIAKVNADEHKDLGQRFGVQGFPTLKWFDGKSETPLDYDKGRDLDSLSSFITDKTGVRPRSSKPPSKVEMLNDKRFNETVGKDKNVLVAFTAPWCGHCKSLAPIWETVAVDFANEPSVIIAKVDAESPDSKKTAQDQEVTGYPTIKWFAAGSTTPVPYSGGRTEADLIAFVNKEAGTHRAVGGGLSATGGTIAAIDTVIQKVLGSKSDIAGGAEEILEAAKAEKGKFAEYYARVVEKVKANSGYLDKELARLQGLIKKGGIAPEKLDDLTSRSNILRRFKIQEQEGKSEL